MPGPGRPGDIPRQPAPPAWAQGPPATPAWGRRGRPGGRMPLRSAQRPQSCPRSQRRTLGELEAREEASVTYTNLSVRWAPGMGDTDTCRPSWSSQKRSDNSVNCLIPFHSSIHKYLLSTCCVPGPVGCWEDHSAQGGLGPCPPRASSLGRMDRQPCKQIHWMTLEPQHRGTIKQRAG